MIYKRFCNALIVIARQIIKIKTARQLNYGTTQQC